MVRLALFCLLLVEIENSKMTTIFALIVLTLASAVGATLNGYEVDVRCNKKGMNARLVFKETFNGLVFSKGFHEDPLCRYVDGKDGVNMAAFNVPLRNCGTEQKASNVTNIIMIQQDPLVETWRDTELVLSCEYAYPLPQALVLDKLDESRTLGKSSVAWMEFKLDGNSAESPLFVGDKVTANIYVRDDGSFNDVTIKNCKARDSDLDSETLTIDLSDELGCPTSQHFLGAFNISVLNDHFVASAHLNLFRFTNKNDVFFTCEVQLCKDVCSNFCPHQHIDDYKSITLRSLSKRSLDLDTHAPQSSNDESTRQLMQLTMNTLANRLRFRKRFRIVETTPSNVEYEEFSTEAFVETEPEETYVETESEETYVQTKTEPEETYTELLENSDLEFTVKKKLTVLAFRVKENSQAGDLDVQECFPKVRFTVLTTFLCFIILCLLLTGVFMALYIRSEKKRHKIDEYLLYCYK